MNVLAGLAVTLPGSLAFAQQPVLPGAPPERMELRERPGRPQTPPVARYVAEGVAEFTLDRTSGQALVRFGNSPEVVALWPQRAPRGDVIYRNDTGQAVVTITGLGGITVFTATNPRGSAATLVGVAEPIRLNSVSNAQQLLIRMEQASQRIRASLGHGVEIKGYRAEGAEQDLEQGILILDALNTTATAFERMARQRDTRLRDVKEIVISMGVRPSVTLAGDTLRIIIAPQEGIAGRPSSNRIALALR